jgi:hypothetical protein
MIGILSACNWASSHDSIRLRGAKEVAAVVVVVVQRGGGGGGGAHTLLHPAAPLMDHGCKVANRTGVVIRTEVERNFGSDKTEKYSQKVGGVPYTALLSSHPSSGQPCWKILEKRVFESV